MNSQGVHNDRQGKSKRKVSENYAHDSQIFQASSNQRKRLEKSFRM